MTIDWVQLGADIGQGNEAGTHVAQRALEHLLGRANIAAAVNLVLTFGNRWELAESVLVYIQSRHALDLAYQVYKTAIGEQRGRAIWLIKNLCHPHALTWVPEFLADPDAAEGGIEVLDQLIFGRMADPDSEEVVALLTQAEQHPARYVREKAAYIRRYLQDFDALDALHDEYYATHGTPGWMPPVDTR
jgi:hypothetical protein